MATFNRAFVKRNVVAGLSKPATDGMVDEAIDRAIHALSNLIHYTSGRSHYDEDVAYLARMILAQRQS